MVEDDLYLPCVYTFEPVKELLYRRPRPEVFEERRYGNASSTKYPGAANLVGLALDRIAIVPVRHGSPCIRSGSVGIGPPRILQCKYFSQHSSRPVGPLFARDGCGVRRLAQIIDGGI